MGIGRQAVRFAHACMHARENVVVLSCMYGCMYERIYSIQSGGRTVDADADRSGQSGVVSQSAPCARYMLSLEARCVARSS